MDNFIDTVTDLFYSSERPLIIMDKSGENLIFNKQAGKLFGYSELYTIDEIFPDLKLDINNPEQNCVPVNSDIGYNLCLKQSSNKKQWIIEFKNSFENDWDEYIKYQNKLHILFLDLLSVESEDELFKKIVRKARFLFDIDRINIFLYSESDQTIIGSWGTDEKGNVVFQKDFKEDILNNNILQDTLDFKDYILYDEDAPLYDKNNKVGIGWNTKSTFYAGTTPVGWISCDNLFSNKPLPFWKKEILSHLSRMTGEFVANLRVEKRLTEKVDKKTRELNRTIKELRETQNNLIESEKMASLGSIISGVAHEINTPIGVAITSSSHMKEETENLLEIIKKDKLTKRKLNKFAEDNLFASELTYSSLKKAGELVDLFKQLSVDQDYNAIEETNLNDLVENVIKSMKYSSDISKIKIITEFDKNLTLKCNYGEFFQIITNLLHNSIDHAFKKIKQPEIKIIAHYADKKLNIIYIDNGIGIPEELHKVIFEPFFSLSRTKGHTGLGLSIVYNNILKLGGKISLEKSTGTRFKIELDY